MEIKRMKSVSGKLYRIMDDIPSVHLYCIEYAKTFEDKGEIIYGWYPLFEPENKCFSDWNEVKALFDKLIAE